MLYMDKTARSVPLTEILKSETPKKQPHFDLQELSNRFRSLKTQELS